MASRTAVLLALGTTALASHMPGHRRGHEARAEAISTLTAVSTPIGTAIGGALDPVTTGVIHGADVASGPEYITIEVTNSCGWPISTSHADNAGCPTIVSGNTAAGTIAASGGVGTFVVPTGWAGNVAVNEYGTGYELNGDDSLIEANYVVADGYSYAVADVDISYVNGFSLPIICKCDGTQVTGCSTNLWAENTCPDDDGVGACINPERADTDATTATTFFAPCAGKAYTFPNDNDANSWGACQNGVISCCVGATCS